MMESGSFSDLGLDFNAYSGSAFAYEAVPLRFVKPGCYEENILKIDSILALFDPKCIEKRESTPKNAIVFL